MGRSVKPRILIAHNRYQARGGEDAVFETELQMLREHGHEVHVYLRDNEEVGPGAGMRVGVELLWSQRTARDVRRLIAEFQPDVVHCHNVFPLISPSIYWAASNAGVPVVQTLHNFRLVCPQAMLLRDGGPCEVCVGKAPWRAARYACYRDSAIHSAGVAAMLGVHRLAGTWSHKIDRYIALSRFSRDIFVRGGLPAQRIRVRPNCLDLPAPCPQQTRSGLLFVGRLTQEKGVEVLLSAIERLDVSVPVTVCGTGPLLSHARQHPRIRCTGELPAHHIYELMRQSAALIAPSLWYEGFPRVLVEAYACGLPVIGSRIGAMQEIVREGRTGWLFGPGDADQLATLLARAAAEPAALARMGAAARSVYEAELSVERGYQQLIQIYEEALDKRAAALQAGSGAA